MPEQLSVPGDQTTAIIKDLTPASAYHLRVTAQNTLGLGLPSEVIQATTEEEGEFIKTKSTKLGNCIIFECSKLILLVVPLSYNQP